MVQPVAIVGLSCRAPASSNATQLWDNICQGRIGLQRHTSSELARLGVSPAQTANPLFVPVSGTLGALDRYDPSCYDFSSAEAPVVNPQLRMLLEMSEEALADAGLLVEARTSRTGVFVSCTRNTYGKQCMAQRGKALRLSGLQVGLLNKTEYVATQVAHRLDLTGPAMIVQSACSSSLVAVHLAAQALRAGDADICLAGGVSIRSLAPEGYLAVPGAMLSPSGHCRPFDDDADGTVFADGGGVVALMLLEHAQRAGHRIYATIIGSAINNDGRDKLSYVAPSVKGQSEVYARALRQAGIDGSAVSYIETHGTGTLLGDPMEVQALQSVYANAPPAGIALGAVKGNVGHLDAGAGVVGLIKAALALHHGQIPPNAGMRTPTGRIDWPASPFYLPTSLRAWPATAGQRRRAGVTALGIGGTNSHLILEEAPPRPQQAAASEGRPFTVWPMPIAAHGEQALEVAIAQAQQWAGHPQALCQTLTQTRPARPFRAFALLEAGPGVHTFDWLPSRPTADNGARPHVFMFPGQGTQVAGMGASMYKSFPAFARCVDEGLSCLPTQKASRIFDLFFGDAGTGDAPSAVQETGMVQPGMLIFQAALAALLRTFGIQPSAMIGHSLGEISCAVVGGALSLPDAVRIAHARGELCEQATPGAMLAVAAPHDSVAHLLDGLDYEVAADNAPAQFVLVADMPTVAAAEERLAEADIPVKVVNRRYGFHSRHLDPIRETFAQRVAGTVLRHPTVPYVSTLDATWISPSPGAAGDEPAPDPRVYFPAQLRHTVRFRDGLRRLAERHGDAVYWELGPGQVLSNFARASVDGDNLHLNPVGTASSGLGIAHLFKALGQAWLHQAAVDWSPLALQCQPLYLPVPMAPASFWLGPDLAQASAETERQAAVEAPSATAPAAPPERLPERLLDVLRTAWAHTLNIAPCDEHTDFFDQGGDSLLAIQLCARIKADTGRAIHPSEVYRLRTPAAMLTRLTRHEPTRDMPPPPATAVADGMPLSDSEQWMFDWASRVGKIPLFNVMGAFRVREPLDESRLRAALHTVLRHAPRLHHVVDTDARSWKSLPPDDRFLQCLDWSDRPDELKERDLQALLQDLQGTPMMLDGAPLFKMHLLKLADDEWGLISCSHHIVWDGWSSTVFWKSLFAAYATGRCQDHAPRSAAARALPDDHVLLYWRDKLQGSEGERFTPGAIARPRTFSFDGVEASFSIDKPLALALQDHAQRQGMPVAAVLLAAYGKALMDEMQQDQVWVRLPVTNRTADNGHAIGLHLLTVACRFARATDEQVFLRAVHQEMTESLGNQAIAPLTLMALAAQGQPSSHFSPFAYEFNHHMYLQRTRRHSPGMRIEPIRQDQRVAHTKCDIGFESRETEAGIQVSLVGYRPVVTPERLVRIAASVQRFLADASLAGPTTGPRCS